jgi:hypothetical protein
MSFDHPEPPRVKVKTLKEGDRRRPFRGYRFLRRLHFDGAGNDQRQLVVEEAGFEGSIMDD